ncbi:hypothetical protein EDD86DRAFT_245664 [Gorgonomyces haynaldii]|nr:hypothetical protein EDD86DRAFT_245664 [Gorgonomyces haynaldii]
MCNLQIVQNGFGLFSNTPTIFSTLVTGQKYLYFQFGDTLNGVGQSVLASGSGLIQTTHSFLDPGLYTANVTISDQPFTSYSSQYYSNTTNGSPTTFCGLQFIVRDATSAYSPNLTLSYNCLTLDCDFIVNADVYDGTQTISDSFKRLGEQPMLSLSNWSHSFVYLMNQSNGWSINAPTAYLDSKSPLVLSFLPQSVGMQQMQLSPLTLELIPPWIRTQFGYSINSTTEYNNLRTLNYTPQRLAIGQSKCRRGQAISVFGGTVGTLAAYTFDAFATAKLVDLARDQSNSKIQSVCASLTTSECSGLSIYDAQILDTTMILGSSLGVFVSQKYQSTVNWTRISFGNTVFDTPQKLSLSVEDDCLGTAIVRVFGSTGGTLFDQIISSTNLFTNTTTFTISMLGLDTSYGFISALNKSASNLYLVGQSPSCSNGSCLYSGCRLLNGTTLLTTFTSCSGMKQNGLDLYVYGSTLYSTSNLAQWTTEIVLSQGYFVQMETKENAYCLLTSTGTIYYGDASNFVNKVHQFTDYTVQFARVLFDGIGRLLLIYTNNSPSYTAAGDNGFFDSQGNTKTSVLGVFPIEYSSLFSNDNAFAATLVPIILRNRTRLYVYPSTAFNFDVQRKLVVKNIDGAAIIVDQFNSNCSMIEGENMAPLNTSYSPALSATLAISGLQVSVNGQLPSLWQAPAWSSVTLTLGSSTWRYSDVGKTIVGRGGSILISSITSATQATGLVLASPGTSSSTLSLASGSWSLYDFRAVRLIGGSFGQTLTISSSGASQSLLTLASGSLVLDSTMAGMLVNTTSGFGYIQYVSGSLTAIAVTGSLVNGVYPANSWYLVPVYSYDTYPIVHRRAWSILRHRSSVPFSVNLDRFVYYVSPNESLNATVTWTGDTDVFVGLQGVGQLTTTQTLLNGKKSVAFTVKDLNVSGISYLSIGLSLEEAQPPTVIRIVHGCSPSRRLQNYRPPSTLAAQMPVSDNIYNGAPEKPLYNSIYPQSTSTGTFKQCLNARNATFCQCTGYVNSQLVAYSDCLSVVPTALYMYRFKLNLTIQDVLGQNNYTDGQTGPNITLSSPQDIIWSGKELYHFRLSVLSRDYCSLQTEFAVYVMAGNLRHVDTAIANTVLVFMGSVLLVYYVFTSTSW